MKRIILLKFFLIFFYSTLFAIPISNNLQSYYLGIENGLSNNDVTCLMQSKLGFIWIGTYDGLNRFDGYRLTSYRKEISNNSVSLPNNRIESLFETAKGYVLIGTLNGVVSYDSFRETFHKLRINNKEGFEGKAIIKEYNGHTYIGSSKYGLTSSTDDKNYSSLPLKVKNNSITSYNVVGLDIESNGTIWLVVKGIGLCKYTKGDNCIHLVDDSINHANGLYIGDHILYIYEDNHIKKFNIATKQWKIEAIDKPVLHFTRTKGGEILASTDGGGIYSKNSQGIYYPKFTKGKDGLLSNSVKQILEDNVGNLWCASLRGGITVFTKKKTTFQSILPNTSNKEDINLYVSSFAKGLNENIWIGTDGLGLFNWNRIDNSIQPALVEQLKNKSITKLLVDKNKKVWIATWNSGLYRLDENGTTKHYKKIDNKLETNNIWNLFEDRNGTIWVSTFGEGGLFKWNKEGDKFQLVANQIGNILCFYESNSMQLWLGNDSDVICYNRLNNSFYTYKIGYRIRAIHEDQRKDFLWIATEGNGLLSLNTRTGKYKRYSENEGLANNNVNQILSDSHFLWLSTFNGISKFDLNSSKFVSFDIDDGLQSNQFSYKASLKISNNEFLFGGIKGITSFNPNKSYHEDNKYFTQISKITIDEQSLAQFINKYDSSYYYKKKELTTLIVPYEEANLKIELTAFTYFNVNKVRYEVKLLGHDPKWVELENYPTITYNRLEPGEYTLVARVMGKDGNWKTNTLLTIVVLNPWYLTWWAKLLYFTSTILFLYTIYTIKRNRTKLIYEAKFSQLAYEKEHELNIKKMNVFSEIVNELRNPLTFVINPLKSYLKNNTQNIEIKNALQNANKLLLLAEQLIPYQLEGNEIKQLKLEHVDLIELINSEVVSLKSAEGILNTNICFNKQTKNALVTVDKEKIAMSIFNVLIFMLTTFKDDILLDIDLLESENTFIIKFSFNQESTNKEELTHYRDESQDYGAGITLTNDFLKLHHGTFKVETNKKTIEISLLKGDWFSAEHNKIWTTNHIENNSEVSSSKVQEKNFEISAKKTILLIDSNEQFRSYLKKILVHEYYTIESSNCESVEQQLSTVKPSLIISDFFLNKSGISFTSKMKRMNEYRHIPIILLTAVASENDMIEAMESGANDVLRKPLDEKLLITKIKTLITEQEIFQDYFLNQITLQYQSDKISSQEKDFLDNCIYIINQNLQNENFNAQVLALKCNMSYSNLYKKIKHICGLSISEFIRSVRLRRAAELILQTQMNISEVAFEVGFMDLKYFRENFKKAYGLSPSQYLKEHRLRFNKKFRIYSN